MRYCKKCLMPDTRPGSIFSEENICQACSNYERRKTINWGQRKEELKKLCDKYRRQDGYYDCIIPVSGGKDSHFLVHTIKKEMGMNPLLVTVGDPFTKTQAGLNNFRNLGDAFGCDHIVFNLSIDLFRRVTRIAFEELGEPLRFVEAAIYTVPLKMAIKLEIPLVVFGEYSGYEYGATGKDNYSAFTYILQIFKAIDIDFWLQRGVSRKEVNAITPPTEEELKKLRPEVIFMSYFSPWSSLRHLEIAKKYGFRGLGDEWQREGCIEDFEQIDSIAYIVHLWLKYPKFGFQRTSDIASRRVREGRLDLPEAQRLIEECDHKLDPRAMEDFIRFLKYTPEEFWGVVERFWNRDIFEKVEGKWRLKDPAGAGLIKGAKDA
ncbi:MAG: N-acetyl sugar amidotransferase [Candidatus Omnitrophota bacterium]|nr:MAG: N-acetyl sugar amidotransferase [Candidatus Omnitrophota bacterium]